MHKQNAEESNNAINLPEECGFNLPEFNYQLLKNWSLVEKYLSNAVIQTVYWLWKMSCQVSWKNKIKILLTLT